MVFSPLAGVFFEIVMVGVARRMSTMFGREFTQKKHVARRAGGGWNCGRKQVLFEGMRVRERGASAGWGLRPIGIL